MEDSFSVCHTFLWSRDPSALLQGCEFLHESLNVLSAEKTQHGIVTVKPFKDPFVGNIRHVLYLKAMDGKAVVYPTKTLVIWSWSNTKCFSLVVNNYVFDA